MSTVTTIAAEAHYLVRQDLYLYLDDADLFASGMYWSDDDTETARSLISSLVTVVRGVVALHGRPDGPQCRACDLPWPCAVLETVHRLVKDPEAELVKIVSRLHQN